MRQKIIQSGYLSFTRKERVGLVMLVLLMVIYPIIPGIYAFLYPPKPEDHTRFEKEIAQLNVKTENGSTYTKRGDDDNYNYTSFEKNDYYKPAAGQLFYFDPNTLSTDGWIKLGVREKTAATIRKYVSKGGRFYKPEDIGKIWGLHEDEIKRLLPYVRIERSPAADYAKYPDQEKNSDYKKPEYAATTIDVNNADTSAFIALPGIGSKLAARIVAFREKLGGFYKAEQVAETYGLHDSVFQKIKNRLVINGSNVRKLNINAASVDELKIHPYLRYNIANAIVQYRAQHGSFSSVSDIKKIMMITDDLYNKASPYLTVK